MLIFSISFSNLIKISYFMDTSGRRVWGERRPKDRVTLQIIVVFTITQHETHGTKQKRKVDVQTKDNTRKHKPHNGEP
jgi:hypothetical protein